MNAYLKAGIAVVLLCVGFVGGCSMKQHQMDKLKADYAEQLAEAQNQSQALSEKMASDTNAAAVQYQAQKAQTEKTIAQLKKELANAKKNHPIDCRLDADRMRIIKAAVHQANNSKP